LPDEAGATAQGATGQNAVGNIATEHAGATGAKAATGADTGKHA
jgi:hypothetical protein